MSTHHVADDAAAVDDDARDLVVLLDDDGRPSGVADRVQVHDRDTRLHLAFSVHLVDERGRTLLTRRALTKKTWPGVWTNSCCGHPRPGEDMVDAVHRRLLHELGVRVDEVVPVLPDFRYRAVDAGGVVENEVCPVHVAQVRSDLEPVPDPDEVAEHAWVDWGDLHRTADRTPGLLSPWVVDQVLAIGPAVPTTSGLP